MDYAQAERLAHTAVYSFAGALILGPALIGWLLWRVRR